MNPTSLPLCCAPEAFNLLARQVQAIESPDALVHGATAIAMHQVEGIELAAVDGVLQGYVDTIRSRVHAAFARPTPSCHST